MINARMAVRRQSAKNTSRCKCMHGGRQAESCKTRNIKPVERGSLNIVHNAGFDRVAATQDARL